MADGSAVPSSSAAVRPYSPCPRSLLPMNSAFWSHTPAHAGAHGHHHQPTAQQTCDAPCCNPQPSDWLSSMSCSIPDCSTAKSAPTPSCTDQCVVVTHHVDQKCDGNCDSGSFPPCDFSCDGFDNNWPCDSTDCTMSFPHVNPTPASYPHHSHGHSHHSHGHHAQDFGHSFHPSPHSYHSYYCPCSSGDFSHCNCSAAASVSPFFSHPSHHQYHQSPHHHQSHQAPPLPPKLPLSTYASTPVPIQTSVPHQFPTSHYPSPSPMFAHQQSSIFQPPHVQMPPPYQPNPQTQPEKSCMWGDCHASFSSTNDLLAHLTANHLPVAEAPAAQPVATLTTSCLWNDCHAHPDSSALLGPDADADAIANFLTTHLLQEHLGLVSPPIEKQHSILPPPPSVTSVTTTLPSIGLLSPVSALSPRAGSEPSDDGSSVLSPLTPSLAALESRSVALTEPETHGCMWEDCNNIFSTCDALTAHIASAHVGSGKAQYECIWRGCPRVGGQPFASKQKILRHIQSHTGHRPFQCSVCKQHFSEAATLQQHMRRHTREKPYQCDYPGCGKAFAITGALTIHKRIHNGEKPFKCTYCERAFSESSNLSKHLRTHTGARPYACLEPGCEKRFARPDQVSRHMNVHRKIIKDETAV